MSDMIELLELAQKGDLQSFSEIVERYQKKLRLWFAVRLNRKDEADDLAQETFLTAFRKLEDFDVERPFSSWLYGIAMNLLRNHWRKKQEISVDPNSFALEQQLEGHIDHVDDGYEMEQLSAMKTCMEKLDHESAELVSQRYSFKKSVAELTTTLNLKHSTVTMRLHRIRLSLKSCIEQRLTEATL